MKITITNILATIAMLLMVTLLNYCWMQNVFNAFIGAVFAVIVTIFYDPICKFFKIK